MSLASIGRQLIQLGRIPVKLHFWFHPTRPRILIRRELVRSALEGREHDRFRNGLSAPMPVKD
jgi:hypothetical protein